MATVELSTPPLTAKDLTANLQRNGFSVDQRSLANGVICAHYDDVGLVVMASLDADAMLYDDRDLDGIHTFVNVAELSGVELSPEWISERVDQGCGCPDCGRDANGEPGEGQISYRELEVIALAEEFMTCEGLDADQAFAKARAEVDGLQRFCLEWDRGMGRIGELVPVERDRRAAG